MANKLRFLQNTLALSSFTLIITVWATVSYLAYQNIQLKENITKITSYEECVNAGNAILESYPSVCITNDGQRFVQQITNNDSVLGDWEIYRHDKLGFEFKYPNNLQYGVQNDSTDPNSLYRLFVGFIPKGNDPTAYNLITLSVVGKYSSIDDYLENCNCIFSKNSGATFSDRLVDNLPAKTIFHQSDNLSDKAVVVKKDEFLFLISVTLGETHRNVYSDEDAEMLFNQILSTFKFLDKTSISFTCPENGWVNCQPILSEEEQQNCTQEAFDWYEENCLNYEGVAY